MNLDLARIRTQLETTPTLLWELLDRRSEAELNSNEGEGTWSAYEVLAHMVDLESQDWVVRIKWIIEHKDSEPFKAVDRERFKQETPPPSVAELLTRFEERRLENIEELERANITHEMMELPGMHPALGAVTLGQLIATWMVHDLAHIAQIVRVLAKQYTDAVGPWKEYLGVLNR